MEDGATRIFLNTRGTNPEEISEELAELQRYFETTTKETARQCKSDRVKFLHRRVEELKSAEEIGVKYMQEWEEKVYMKEEGRKDKMKERIIEAMIREL